LRFRSRSADETRRAARRLAEAIEAAEETRTVGLVIGLAGPLGAGKTEWVKGLAEGFGIEPELVASPTFVIASEYAGRRELVHADLYRLDHAAELDAAGFLDWLVPGHVVAIEWADRFPGALPADRIELSLERTAGVESERWVEVAAAGPIAGAVVRRFEKSFEKDAPCH
jgi:tRNA threonylcarbamoyladenosine biosynthesis protein TsaE